MTIPVLALPEDPPPLPHLVSKYWSDSNPEVAALARLIRAAFDRAIVANASRKSGTDLYVLGCAHNQYVEALAEMANYTRELNELLVAARKDDRE